VKIIDVVRNHQCAHNFSMTMIRLSGSQLHAARVLVGLSRENLAERAACVATASVNGRPERCRPGSALPQLLSTLTDEFAFRRISRIDVRVLPIQIEHRWQDIAASPPPLPCADYSAVTKAQD
jgi:hypothetical protein